MRRRIPKNGPVYLTENEIAELAQIGSQYLYLNEFVKH